MFDDFESQEPEEEADEILIRDVSRAPSCPHPWGREMEKGEPTFRVFDRLGS